LDFIYVLDLILIYILKKKKNKKEGKAQTLEPANSLMPLYHKGGRERGARYSGQY
jgi:hypothetical protein